MVIAHSPKAGQWAKQESHKVYQRTNVVIFGTASLMMIAMGFIAALGFKGPWFLLLELVLLLCGVLLLWRLNRRMMAYIDHAASDRLRWLRGAQAEAYVSMKLRDGFRGDDRWHLIDNLKLDATSDIDHVLVGPGGFFVISTKSQRGLFQLSGGGGAKMNGHPCDWPQDAVRQALRLKDQLAVADPAPGSKQPWIQAVLCVPFAHLDLPPNPAPGNKPGKTPDIGHPPSVGACWIVNEDTLLDTLEPDPIPKGRIKLHKTTQARLVAALQTLADRHA